MRNTFLALAVLAILTSCEIREEIHFNKDGSGSYSVGFDMSEMMKMGEPNDSVPHQKAVDTLIVFSEFLEAKKDSIAGLPIAEQKKLEALRPLRFALKMNDEEKKANMILSYAFRQFTDVSKFGEAIKLANINELQQQINPMEDMMSPSETENDSTKDSKSIEELFKMAESFDTRFSEKRFSRTITRAAIAEIEKKKDTSLKADDPFVDMIHFKQVYKFPYRIKSISNTRAKVLSDFMGVEVQANMYEMNNDPEFFNIEVEFEK